MQTRSTIGQQDEAKIFVVDPRTPSRYCTCGNDHAVPEVKLCSSPRAFAVLTRDCRQWLAERSVLIVDDENTHVAAGKSIAKRFADAAICFEQITLPGDLSVSEEMARSVAEKAGGHGLILAVGAGSVNDTGKYAATLAKMPYWTVPTAPSMNGYTSAIAAVKISGVKRTLPASPPVYVYADPAVISYAPGRLTQAGYCDIMAKSVSDVDWQCESLLFSGSYCALPSAIVAEAEAGCIGSPEKIAQGDEAAVMGLFKGLLISGVSMTLAGSSAPASGGEHLVSHFLDMREPLTGRVPELHGLQVGAGIILSAVCYQRLAELTERKLNVDATRLFDADAARISGVWGKYSAEVEKQFLQKRDSLLSLNRLMPARWGELNTLFSRVRSPEFFMDIFRRVGCDLSLGVLRLNREEFLQAAETARMIRNRITVLDLAAHAGILKDAARQTLALLS